MFYKTSVVYSSFAFVEFKSEDSAVKSMKLKNIEGKPIRVEPALRGSFSSTQEHLSLSVEAFRRIIGIKEATITKIRKMSGVKITVLPKTSSEYRTIALQGSPSQMKSAKGMILSVQNGTDISDLDQQSLKDIEGSSQW
jgi:RNA recognition motif-containing protein